MALYIKTIYLNGKIVGQILKSLTKVNKVYNGNVDLVMLKFKGVNV